MNPVDKNIFDLKEGTPKSPKGEEPTKACISNKYKVRLYKKAFPGNPPLNPPRGTY